MKKQTKRAFGLLLFLSTFVFAYTFVNAETISNEINTRSEVVEQNSVIDEPTSRVIRELSKMLSENTVDATINQVEVTTISNPYTEEDTIEEVYTVGYTTTAVRVRKEPNIDSEILDLYYINTKIEYIVENEEWVKIKYNNDYAYISINYISNEKTIVEQKQESGKNYSYDGSVLNPRMGVCYGPSGKETYYNLNMNGVIKIMRDMGNNDEYWIREDGCKMLGNYIMVAADLNTYPRGSIVQTSLGEGIVCDTGDFTSNGSGVSLDIATNW